MPASAEAEATAALGALFARLSRAPDLEAPELFAFDATDELLLATAAERSGATGSAGRLDLSEPGAITVIGDRHGALTLGAIAVLGAREPRVYQDPLLGERALDANAAALGSSGRYKRHPLRPELLRGARLVLMQLPRSLAELDELAQTIARWAPPDAVLLAGARVKHLSRGATAVLERSFTSVTAGLARRKSRVLTVTGPRDADALGPPRFPIWGDDPDLAFALAAHGATFGGATLDHGSRLLLRGLAEEGWPRGERIVDLGCGNGALAVSAALARPGASVRATDQSRAAVAATRLTADAAGVGDRVEVVRADAAEAIPDGWADLILLNPPFHSGAAVHAGVAHRIIRSCSRALAPGGELRIVFNSHLGYRPLVERVVGPTRQVARDRTFTVLAASRRS